MTGELPSQLPLNLPEIRVHNNLVEAFAPMTLGKQRILNYLLAFEIHPFHPVEETYEVPIADFRRQYDISTNRVYRYVDELTDDLMATNLTIRKLEQGDPDDEPSFQKINFFSHCSYQRRRGVLEIGFTPKFLPYVENLKACFTRIPFDDVRHLSCVYSAQILMILNQWEATGRPFHQFDYEKLRFMLGVGEKKYTRWDNFKSRVLEPAETDLKTHSSTFFTWEALRKGRGGKVIAIRLYPHKKVSLPRTSLQPDLFGTSADTAALIALGFSKAKAADLAAQHSPEYLAWVCGKINERIAEAKAKKTPIQNPQAYAAKVIAEEGDNFAALAKQQDEIAQLQEAERIAKAQTLAKQLDMREQAAQDYLEREYERWLNQHLKERLEADLEAAQALQTDFETSRLPEAEEWIQTEFQKKGYRSLSVEIDFHRFVDEQWNLAQEFPFEHFLKDEGFEVRRTEDKVLLLKQGEAVLFPMS